MSIIGIQTRNQSETQIMEICTRANDWLAKKLNVVSTQEFGRQCNWGKDAFHGGLWMNDTKQSVLNFRNLYGEKVIDMLRIIGHELRHAYQHQNNMLTDRKGSATKGGKNAILSGTWNGASWTGFYSDAPWEIDARAYEQEYKQMIIDSGIISEEELNMVLPGDRVTYFNEDQKKKELNDSSEEAIHYFEAATISKAQDDKNGELRKKAIVNAGFILKNNKWSYGDTSRSEQLVMQKTFKSLKKEFAVKYRNDALAYLTDSQYKNTAKKDRFWAAQENILQFDTVELAMSDLSI